MIDGTLNRGQRQRTGLSEAKPCLSAVVKRRRKTMKPQSHTTLPALRSALRETNNQTFVRDLTFYII